MNAQELRDKSVEELQDDLVGLYKDQFYYSSQYREWKLGQVQIIS